MVKRSRSSSSSTPTHRRLATSFERRAGSFERQGGFGSGHLEPAGSIPGGSAVRRRATVGSIATVGVPGVDVITWGPERARAGPWRGDRQVAYLAPVANAPIPSAAFVRRCL